MIAFSAAKTSVKIVSISIPNYCNNKGYSPFLNLNVAYFSSTYFELFYLMFDSDGFKPDIIILNSRQRKHLNVITFGKVFPSNKAFV